jgi:hypothetical protein
MPEYQDELKSRIHAAVAYLIDQANRNDGLWEYGHRTSQEPFSARTYPEVQSLLAMINSALVYEIPKGLSDFERNTPNLPYRENTSHQTTIKTPRQFRVRLALTLKKAADLNPNDFLESYIDLRRAAIANYAGNDYYETFDLCCLLSMLCDRDLPPENLAIESPVRVDRSGNQSI